MRLKSLAHLQIYACIVGFCVWLSAGEVRTDGPEDLLVLATSVKEAGGGGQWPEILDLRKELEARPEPDGEDRGMTCVSHRNAG